MHLKSGLEKHERQGPFILLFALDVTDFPDQTSAKQFMWSLIFTIFDCICLVIGFTGATGMRIEHTANLT